MAVLPADVAGLPLTPEDLVGVDEALLVLDPTLLPAVRALAEKCPATQVRVLATDEVPAYVPLENLVIEVCRTVGERVDLALSWPRPGLVVESGNQRKGQKWACFRELFLLLNPGGRYVVDRLSAVDDPALADREGETVLELVQRLVSDAPVPAIDLGLAEAIKTTAYVADTLVVTKRNRHLVKLRDAAATAVLHSRYGATWGAQVAARGAYTYPSRAQVRSYGSGPSIGSARINVPQLALRRYDAALVETRQRVRLDDFYLPDTFRHHRAPRLAHHMLRNASSALDTDNNPAPPTAAEPLAGDYFYFDAEYPGHFGHVTTEVLSRFWGWTQARRRVPGLRPLFSAGKDATDIPDYQRVLFEALDIPLEDRYVLQAGMSVEVEHLWAATPGFSMPHYADRRLAGIWETVARRLSPELGRPRSERLFVSRRGGWRPCHNQSEVEGFFAEQGFEIFFPGDHPIAEQILRFRSARVLAGFGGSSMFGSMFAPGSPRILINGDSNTASNEFLIAAVVGAPLHYFWSPADLNHPPGGWDVEAFHAGFTFELNRHTPALRSVISQY